jgi:hypothetical protein
MICGYVRPKKMPHHSANTRSRPPQIIGAMPVDLGELESFRFHDLAMRLAMLEQLIFSIPILLLTTVETSH